MVKHTINFVATSLYTAILLAEGAALTKPLATEGTDGICALLSMLS